jgi:hypothetical protein
MRKVCLILAAMVGCSSEPSAALSFSLAEIHQLTSTFVSGCVLQHDWATQFTEERGRAPVVRVRGVTNATGEDLDTNLIGNVVASELARIGRVIVAPASKKADFLLSGRLGFESDLGPDVILGRGHRSYLSHLAVVSAVDGRPMCSASGAITRWLDD